MNIYFLGGGNMAAAIAGGLVRQGGHRVHIANRGKEKRERLAEELGVSVSEKLPELAADDVLVLAVKPQDMQAACQGVQTNGALVLSVAAGLSIATLSRYLGGTRRIVRVMPNTPGKIGLGGVGDVCRRQRSDQDKAAADSIMRAVGITVWLDGEERLHDITGISGSGAGLCVFSLLDALKQAARQQGFGEKRGAQAEFGNLQRSRRAGRADRRGFRRIAAKRYLQGGTTHEAIETFKVGQVAETVAKGVAACVNRSRELAEQFEAV